jgi:hypothetical protein
MAKKIMNRRHERNYETIQEHIVRTINPNCLSKVREELRFCESVERSGASDANEAHVQTVLLMRMHFYFQ